MSKIVVTFEPLKDSDPIPFGKYKDACLPMSEVPADYLLWFYDRPWSKDWPRVRAYVEENRARLAVEDDDLQQIRRARGRR